MVGSYPKKLNVLDKGHVALLNMSGPVRRPDQEFDADDVDPALSARMSFDQALDVLRPREKDLALDEYLIVNRHGTPIEMIEVWIEMKLPIFVARQFVRHRTATINEVSARYVKLESDWYVPDPKIVGVRPEKMKQGRVISDDPPTEAAIEFCTNLNAACTRSYAEYGNAIARGVPPELARLHLHLNHYTKWIWKQDLRNVMGFLALRAHDHAQQEAQQYAYAIIELLRSRLPHLTMLYEKHISMQGARS